MHELEQGSKKNVSPIDNSRINTSTLAKIQLRLLNRNAIGTNEMIVKASNTVSAVGSEKLRNPLYMISGWTPKESRGNELQGLTNVRKRPPIKIAQFGSICLGLLNIKYAPIINAQPPRTRVGNTWRGIMGQTPVRHFGLEITFWSNWYAIIPRETNGIPAIEKTIPITRLVFMVMAYSLWLTLYVGRPFVVRAFKELWASFSLMCALVMMACNETRKRKRKENSTSKSRNEPEDYPRDRRKASF
jgi:hypothetical protein